MKGLFLVWMLVWCCESFAATLPWRPPLYGFVACELPLREAVESFAVAQGLRVVMSPQVQGVLSGTFEAEPPQAFLERLCATHQLTWYYDGATLYLYTAHEGLDALVELRALRIESVQAMLEELGVSDARFPLKTAAGGSLLLVQGPPRYVQLVRELIASAERLRAQQAVCDVETRLFPIVNTWADDVQLNTAGPEGSSTAIKGVATLLSELVAMVEDGVREQTATNATAEVSASATPRVAPIIKADNRLNAVVVRDVVTRMPMYEALIRQLDVAQPLVEISITVVELSHDDALDWELSLRAQATHGNASGAVGQVVDHLVDGGQLGGRGLSGAFAYIGDAFRVESSITALQERGKAQSISRSALLTLNNMAAEITDTQSYHVRIVGDKLATLETVSAGTQLRIKPRIVPSASPEEKPQIWLTMELEDGGFESMVIDAMPMSRESSLSTQAAIREGESLLLAGYLRDLHAEKTWGIPWLRDIAWIGWLFGGQSTSNATVQRFFILTPRVITCGGLHRPHTPMEAQGASPHTRK